MSVNLNDIKSLNDELSDAIINFTEHHAKMNEMRAYYQKSAFFTPRAGEPRMSDRQRNRNNYLKKFANLNIAYTAAQPIIKVPTPGAEDVQRMAASMRERILYATYQRNNFDLKQKKYAFDATVMSCAINETRMNLKTRQVELKRHDPRFVVWSNSNNSDGAVTAFWAVFSISKDEAWRRFGVRPTANPLPDLTMNDPILRKSDGQDWFTMAIRWDGETRTAWVGDVFIEEPHSHMMGVIPVDICVPFEDGDETGKGSFYIEDLVPHQANINEIIMRRARIVRRMGNPVVYGRGLAAGQQIEDVRNQFAEQDGGFIGLKQTGELGVLQLQDTTIFKEAKDDAIVDMMRESGFNAAAFGESAGANTSGDALDMAFSPTEMHIKTQMINWIAFWRSINSKILRLYDVFGMTGEEFTIQGSVPYSTLVSTTDGTKQLQRGAFEETFIPKTVIAGNYFNVCTAPSVTPKNSIEEKRQAMDGVTTGFWSRTTAYERIGLDDPEAELALLQQEKSNPLLNSELTSMLLPDKAAAPAGGNDKRKQVPSGAKAAQSGEVR